MLKDLKKTKQYLLSGVSYAIPFVACGGILIALAIAFAPMGAHGPDFANSPYLKKMLDIGVASFTLLVPILAGFIAYGMADRPGLVPGMVGGWIATHLDMLNGCLVPKDATAGCGWLATNLDKINVDGASKDVTTGLGWLSTNLDKVNLEIVPKGMSAGFLGGIVAGLLAGLIVMQLKKIKPPVYLRPIMPILVIPVIGSLVVGAAMFLIGIPISEAMTAMSDWLAVMGDGNKVVLALVLGAMIAFDMGGPVNKVAFFFSAAMIEKGVCAPMGACAAAICIPPLGLGLATIIGKKLWSEQERDSGYAALAMGSIGITEGAIPFAAADPVRVIPVIMCGSMVGAVVAMLGGAANHAPHGGLIVLPVVDGKIMYVVGILAGVATVALGINALRAWSAKKAAAK